MAKPISPIRIGTMPSVSTTRFSLIWGLLLAVALGSGCAGGHIPADEQPRTLRDVNQQLDGRWARIQRTDGQRIERLADVQARPDSTTFYHRMEQTQRTISTRSVRAVQVRGNTGAGKGSLLGAAPGIAVAVLGGGIALSNSGDEGIGAGLVVAYGLVMVGGGLALGLLGGASGAILGDVVSDDEWITVYEGPVERYRR